MNRKIAFAAALSLATGCRNDVSNTITSTSTGPVSPTATLESFTGTWRSVTPSLEFIRLSVHSLSSQQGALGAHLTLSGVALDGSGHVAGDSVVAELIDVHTGARTGVLVMRSRGPNELRVRLESGTTTDLALVREQ